MSEPEWGIVELLGHVRLAGRVSEVERFGAKLGRIDVPDTRPGATPDAIAITHLFNGSSLYRYTPCTEETARQVAATNQPAPVHRWELRLPPPTERSGGDEGDDDCSSSETVPW